MLWWMSLWDFDWHKVLPVRKKESTAIDAGCTPEASNNEIADLNGSLAFLTNELVSSFTGVIESFSKQDAFSLKFVTYET